MKYITLSFPKKKWEADKHKIRQKNQEYAAQMLAKQGCDTALMKHDEKLEGGVVKITYYAPEK